jgi:hypothetical protein
MKFGESSKNTTLRFWEHGMSTLINAKRAYVPTSALAKAVSFDDSLMHVSLADGRILSVPLIWFPLLQAASPEQRANYEIAGGGISIHWPDIVGDLSVAGLMAGADSRSL